MESDGVRRSPIGLHQTPIGLFWQRDLPVFWSYQTIFPRFLLKSRWITSESIGIRHRTPLDSDRTESIGFRSDKICWTPLDSDRTNLILSYLILSTILLIQVF